jgi:high-affinity iron transporter
MLIPFLIMLREGIEAALIVGIVASYLKQSGRGALMPAVWVGVLLATALSLFAGAGLQLLAAEFPQKQQELFEGVVGLIAVVMLTSMVFWMRKAARSIKGELQASIDKALTKGSDGQGWALIGMVFLAVAREGLESVFFLLAVFQQSSGWEAPVGALAGIAVSVVIGWGLYSGGVRLDLRRFFRYTGLFILLVAAGPAGRRAAQAARRRRVEPPADGGVRHERHAAHGQPRGRRALGPAGLPGRARGGRGVVYLAFLAVALFFFLRSAPRAGASRGCGRLKTFDHVFLFSFESSRLKPKSSHPDARGRGRVGAAGGGRARGLLVCLERGQEGTGQGGRQRRHRHHPGQRLRPQRDHRARGAHHLHHRQQVEPCARVGNSRRRDGGRRAREHRAGLLADHDGQAVAGRFRHHLRPA